MFHLEKGNWYINENTWAEYGVFKEGETTPVIVTVGLDIAEWIVDQLNNARHEDEWLEND
jgi:hypothetical protein